jgi:hypothetical protein
LPNNPLETVRRSPKAVYQPPKLFRESPQLPNNIKPILSDSMCFSWHGNPRQPSLAEAIAMTTSYFPKTEAARINWAINYRDQIAVHGPTVGLNATANSARCRRL